MRNFYANQRSIASPTQVSRFVSGTYGWMALAILVTASTSFFLGGMPAFMAWAVTTPGLITILLSYFLSFFVALGSCAYAKRNKGDIGIAAISFLVFSVAMGAMITPLVFSYAAATVAGAFFITSSTFGFFAVLGFTTKTDLSRMGAILSMALVGLIITTFVNMFLGIAGLSALINYAAVIIFTGLTAWDSQQIRQLAQNGGDGADMMIMSMSIYLNFMNLFLHILQIMGGSDD